MNTLRTLGNYCLLAGLCIAYAAWSCTHRALQLIGAR